MNKFTINNIYANDGKTLVEIILSYFISFLDEDLNFCENNKDIILSN